MTPDNGEDPLTPSISPHAPKARSCTGLLYFSSSMKNQARNPLCFGFSRPQDRAHNLTAGKSDQDATKECKSSLDFKYACVGYSLHHENEAVTSDIPSDKHIELPLCGGIEVLSEMRDAKEATARKHQHMNPKEDNNSIEAVPIMPRQPSSTRPPSISGNFTPEEFGSRFIHNAGLVAAAVQKNLLRVGKSIKSMANDMVYRDGRRPK